MRGGKGNDNDRSCAKGREITGLIVNLPPIAYPIAYLVLLTYSLCNSSLIPSEYVLLIISTTLLQLPSVLVMMTE
jgi:hypothetical protein